MVDEGRFLDWCTLNEIDDRDHQRRLWTRIQAIDAEWAKLQRKGKGARKRGEESQRDAAPQSRRIGKK